MKRVIIPTDFSEVSDNAINYLMALPDGFADEVILFHGEANVNEHFIRLNRQVNILSEKFKVEIINSEKNFDAKNVLNIIETRLADLVVMGTSGEEGSIMKKIFGNNTSSLIEELPIPMLVVPLNFKKRGIKDIVYASDLSDLKDEANLVVPLARSLNADLRILHVTPVYPDIYDTEKMDVDKVVGQMKFKYAYDKISYVIEETDGDNEIRKGIDKCIDQYRPDLLVMFHQQRSDIDKLIIPSDTVNLITHLQIPLMVYPKIN
jgi:nucleotide-binding universal stress UspA family protein